jgi:pimeloyl-ACP methyl ester carboxylesterase
MNTSIFRAAAGPRKDAQGVTYARMRRSLVVLLLLGALAIYPVHGATSIDAVFTAFWDAPNPSAAEKASHAMLSNGVSFNEAWMRLKAGRTYSKEKTGLIRRPSSVGGVTIDNIIEIPAEYDPVKKWPLRVQLHGGVGRDLRDDPQPQSARIPGEPQIYIEPQAYWEAAWWHTTQVDNILGLLDFVRRKYNVDETQTYITGISDGGTGTFFFALREPNPWSACLSLNGQPLVLANRDARIEGNLYLGNLANCPLYVVNGDHDPLYPAETVTPLVDAMHKAGVMPVYHIQPNERHDVHWWPDERASYEMFVHTHPRSAHPERLSWETDRTDRFNRVRWLVIDKLGTPKSPPSPQASAKPLSPPAPARQADTLEDVNVFTFRSSTMNVFPRRRQVQSGRVDVERHGNAFDARTRGVSEFTLLVSPDVIDFAKPVQVTVNGAQVFSGLVKRDLPTLLKWAARDNDRTALYGAELHITVPN